MMVDSDKDMPVPEQGNTANSGNNGNNNAENNSNNNDDNEPIPFMQKVMDNPFLLLFLGVTIPAVLYIIWGVMEIAQIPIAK